MSWTGDPVWLADVLRAEGLKVIEHDGWKARGHGDFRDIRGVICHHTAGGGPDDWKIVQNGRPDLEGPLAQLVLERDGTYRVIAVGVCWHAGRGSWPGWPTNDANWHTIGIEAVNDGVGQPWPAVQLDAYRRGCAAIARKVGFGADKVAAHREYSSEGKIDPTGIDMNRFRRDVQAAIAGAPQPKPVNEIDKYAAATPWLGKRITVGEVNVGKDGRGRAAEFANAIVYWSASTGAHAVPRADQAMPAGTSGLLEEYQRRGGTGGALGFPVREFARLTAMGAASGAVQAFEGGVLYRRDGDPQGAVVLGAIGARWGADGYERGPLGYPLADEQPTSDGGRVQQFERGILTWHPSGVTQQLTKEA